MEKLTIKEYINLCEKVPIWWEKLSDIEKITKMFEMYKKSNGK